MQQLNPLPYDAPRLPATQQSRTPRDVVAVVFRHGWLMVISFFGIFFGAVVVTWLMPQVYEAHVKIMVKRDRIDPVIGTTQNTQLVHEDLTEQDLNSEVELLKSRDLLEKVVVETGFHKQRKTSFFRSVLMKLSPGPNGQSEEQ